MSDGHHIWRIGSTPPLIRPHSVAKHRVISQYLSRYVEVLTANPRIPEFRLTLVDGFAGGGLYQDSQTYEERDGSPLLMLKAMRDAAAKAQLMRAKEFSLDIDYIFVESSKETYEFLKATTQQSEFRALLADKIKIENDTFVRQVPSIVRHIQGRERGCRAIFILDQFGYADVPFSAIKLILSQLSNAEIILTFATDSLIDYLSERESTQKTLGFLGLQLGADRIRSAKQDPNWRRAIQFLLHGQILLNSGAKFYTPFFIRSKDSHRDYWLIHLSNHSRARDVMVEYHWRENTSFAHFGGPGLSMLGYDQDQDIKLTGQPYLFDDNARARTQDCLIEQLPARLFAMKDGVTFEGFFSRITNETPATSEDVKSVLAIVHGEGVIEIRDKTGLIIRRAGVQHRTDVIKPSSQLSLFMPGT